MDEAALIADADRRAAVYVASVDRRRVFPDAAAIAALSAFEASLPEGLGDPAATIDLLDRIGSPATVVSNGPRYFGFVVGASLPIAAAAERLSLAWDQCASSRVNSPAADAIERAAGRMLLDALDLPRDAAVGFGTSATACGIACLSAARRSLLARVGWDFDRDGLSGAPEIRVVVSQTVHITVRKALRLFGFGEGRLIVAATDAYGRIDPAALPALDDRTILCLQAGEVNTGEFDPFVPLIAAARAAGAWVHVDGAFGLWARAARASRDLTEGADGADSWTVDGHKWLNTPYDGAMAICRDGGALAGAMSSDAAYVGSDPEAQRNRTLEFSRRARGVAVWAAMHALGRAGIAAMVDRHRAQARRLADGLRSAGLEVLNRVVLNQVLARCRTDAHTAATLAAVQAGGEIWFGASRWDGRPAMRLSVSSWRTTDDDIERCIAAVAAAQDASARL